MTAYGIVGGDPHKLNSGGYTLGDVVAADSSGNLQRVAVGPSGDVLTANSAATEGVDWEPAGGAGGGVPTSRKVNTTSPLTGGGDLSADRTLGFDPTAVANGAFTELQVAGLVTDLNNLNSSITALGTSKQNAAAGLTSLAALNAAGFVIATSASTYTVRALQASDVPALDASKITTGVMNQNRLPTPDAIQNLVSGSWYAAPNQGSVSQTAALAANTALLILLCIMRDATLTGLAVEVVATDSGTIRFGLASDVNGQPGSFLNDFGTASAGSAAVVQPGSTPNIPLTAGTRMWVVIAPQGGTGTLTLRNRSGCDPSIPLNPVSNATPGTLNAIRNAYTSAGVSGALGTGAVTITAVGSGPVVACRLT